MPIIEDIFGFWGFSMLRYIQKEFNSGFSNSAFLPRVGYTPMPRGAEITGASVKGLIVDYSLLPRVIKVEEQTAEQRDKVAGIERDRVPEGASEFDLEERARIFGLLLSSEEIARIENTPSGWTRYLVGPDIFLGYRVADSEGESGERSGAVTAPGVGRKLVGIEHCDYTLVKYGGIFEGEDVKQLGEAVERADDRLGLRGKFVQVLWDISQFTPNSKRNVMVMSTGKSPNIFRRGSRSSGRGSGSSGRGSGSGVVDKKKVRAISCGLDVLGGEYPGWTWDNAIIIPELWCRYLFMEMEHMFD